MVFFAAATLQRLLCLPNVAFLRHDDVQIITTATAVDVVFAVDTWLTEIRIDQIRVVLQKGYVLYV